MVKYESELLNGPLYGVNVNWLTEIHINKLCILTNSEENLDVNEDV